MVIRHGGGLGAITARKTPCWRSFLRFAREKRCNMAILSHPQEDHVEPRLAAAIGGHIAPQFRPLPRPRQPPAAPHPAGDEAGSPACREAGTGTRERGQSCCQDPSAARTARHPRRNGPKPALMRSSFARSATAARNWRAIRPPDKRHAIRYAPAQAAATSFSHSTAAPCGQSAGVDETDLAQNGPRFSISGDPRFSVQQSRIQDLPPFRPSIRRSCTAEAFNSRNRPA